MRDDELRSRLTQSNPWWRAAAGQTNPVAWVATDRLLKDKRQRDIGFRATILDDIAAAPVADSLVVLRGPRRVGKSVVIRELAATLCERPDIDTRQIVHFACDQMTARDLTRSITLARDLTRTVDNPTPKPRIWLLDEIGQVRGWTAALKTLRDGGVFGDETVIVTSSSWRKDEDVEGNLLAGRAGTSGARRVRLLMPMTFRDFAVCTRQDELVILDPARPDELQEPDVEQQLQAVAFDVEAYDLAWQTYLTCGGFPRAVASYQKTGTVEPAYLQDLHAWLRADVDPDGSAESIPTLLQGLHERSTSPLNLVKASADLNYSRDTFERRLNRLVGSFAAVWNPQRDDSGATIARTQAKLYLTDPILGWLPSQLRQGLNEPDFTRLTEQTLAVAMARAVDTLEEGRLISQDTIGYARTGSGNEVDLCPLVVPGGGREPLRTVPIESKWVDKGWRADAKPITAKYGHGIVATKSILDLTTPVWAVPAPLIALLLG